MNILMVSMDRNIFNPNSKVAKRMISYGSLFDRLEIVVFTKREKFEQTHLSDNVFIYPTQSKNKFFFIKDAVNIGKKFSHIDVVTGDGPETGISANKISKILGVKFLMQIHTDIFSKKFINHSIQNRIRASIVKNLIKKADRVRVVSDRIKKDLNHKDVVVLPVFQEFDNKGPADLQKPKEYTENYKNFITVCRLESEKNIKYLLEIFKVLKDKNYKLFIIGDGGQKDKLTKFVEKNSMQEKVEFLGWVEDTQPYLSHTDFYIQTSLYEGFGMSVYEAAMSKIPVISTDSGICGSLLKDKGDFLMLPFNDSVKSANLISEFELDKNLQIKMVQSAKEKAQNLISSYEEYLDKFKNTFTFK